MKLAFLWLFSLPIEFWLCEKRDGMEYTLRELSKEHEVVRITTTKENEREYVVGGLKTIFMKRDNVLANLKDFKPDFILINSGGVDKGDDIVEEFHKKSFIAFYEHGRYELPHPEKVDCLFTNSESRRRKAANANKLPLKKVRIANHGVDTSLFYPREGVEKKYLAVGIGDFRGVKRWILLLRAWRLIPEGKLLIIGRRRPPLASLVYYERCKNEASALGIGDRVDFLDFISHDRLPEMLSLAEMIVHPSQQETGARSLMEAMAMGLPPIILSDCEGNVDVGLCRGDMVKACPSPRDLAAAIMFLKEDEEERKRIGQRAAKRIREECSYEGMLESFRETLKEVKPYKETPSSNENKTEIAIITTSMNYGQYIEGTLKSVLAQEGDFKIHHFVIDGGSTDNTHEVLSRYKNKAEIVVQKGIDQTGAINLAWKLIQERYPNTKYVGWINADDYYYPTFLKESVKALEAQPTDVAATCGDVIFSYPQLDKKPNRSVTKIEGNYVPPTMIRRGNFIWCPTILMRMDTLLKVKEGKPLVRSYYNQDYYLWIDILSSGYRVYHNHLALEVHRIHDKQLGKLNPTRAGEEHREAVKYAETVLPAGDDK